MKLRFTTKSFIFSVTLFLVFRVLQIVFLTESETAFLKPQFLWLSIVGTVLCLLPTVYTAADDFYAFRCPEHVGRTGAFGAVICLISGIMIFISGIASVFSGSLALDGLSGILQLVFPLLGCAGCLIIAASELFDFSPAKPTFLLLLAALIYEFICAYAVYTGRPLRVRTVYEILALVTSILFFLNLSKANSGIKTPLSFRLVYPLGSLAATFCFLATVPELLCAVFKCTDRVTEASAPMIFILGTGIIITYLTIASNTFSNTRKNQ